MRVFVIAVIAIVVLGLGFAGGLHYILNVQYQHPNQQAGLLDKGPVTREPVSLTLDLTNPDDNSISFESSVLISGKTSPNAVIILDLNHEYTSLEANSDGNFSTTLHLETGVNNLTTTAFDDLGNSKTDSRIVYYSTEKI